MDECVTYITVYVINVETESDGCQAAYGIRKVFDFVYHMQMWPDACGNCLCSYLRWHSLYLSFICFELMLHKKCKTYLLLITKTKTIKKKTEKARGFNLSACGILKKIQFFHNDTTIQIMYLIGYLKLLIFRHLHKRKWDYLNFLRFLNLWVNPPSPK